MGFLYLGTYSSVDAKEYFQKLFSNWFLSYNAKPSEMLYNYFSNEGSLSGNLARAGLSSSIFVYTGKPFLLYRSISQTLHMGFAVFFLDENVVGSCEC